MSRTSKRIFVMTMLVLLLVPVFAVAEKSLTELSVQLKALEVASQVDYYIQDHPEKTISALQNDSFFNGLAVQMVGNTGYTAVLDSDSGMFYFHPQSNLIGQYVRQFNASLPRLWAIFENTLGPVCKESFGLYDWLEVDGSISNKYLYLACVKSKTADGKPLMVAATTYLDELDASHYLSAYRINEFSSLAQDSIKQKAVDVARQVEIYIKAHPDMTVTQLQNDTYFNQIAVQPVGKTGYTALADTNSLINRFHQNPKIVNIDLSTLAAKLPGFWRIMSKTRGGFEAEGVYDWQEADGSITQKYMYIAVVNALTADGVRFNVAATTYLSDYATTEKLPVAMNSLNLTAVSSLPATLFDLNYVYVIIGVVGLIVFIFLIVSLSKDSEKDVRTYFVNYVLSAILLVIACIVRLHVKDIVVAGFMMRIVVFSVGCFLFYYFFSVISIARVKIKPAFMWLIYLTNLAIMIVTIFTNLIVRGAVYDPEIMQKYGILNMTQGPLYPVFVILAILYLVSTLMLLFSVCIKKRDFKLIVLFATFMVAFLGLGIYSSLSHFWNPLILLVLPFTVVCVYAALLFKLGFIRIKRNMALVVIIVFILLLITFFVFNTFIVSERMREGTRRASDEAQAIIIKQDAIILQNSMNNLVSLVSFIAKNKAILSGNTSLRHSVIDDLNTYVSYSFGKTHAILLDNDKHIIDQDSTFSDPTNINFSINAADYSEFLDEASMNSAYERRQITVSNVFKSRDSRDMISLFVPIYENAEFKGMLVVSFGVAEMLAPMKDLTNPKDDKKIYLFIGDAAIGVLGSRAQDLMQLNSTFNNIKKEIHAGNRGLFENTIINPINTSEPERGVAFSQEFILFYEPVRVLDGYWGIISETSRSAIDDIIFESVYKLWLVTFSTIAFILLSGILLGFMIMRDLRHKVDEKTREVIAVNARLEETVTQRTQELDNINKELEQRVASRSVELNKKIKELTNTRTAILNILEDVNASKDEIEKSHDSLLKLNHEMEKANVELKRMDNYKNEFISVTAHELKTPLASIHGFAGLLQNKNILSNHKQRDYYLSIIMQDADRLKKLIDDILDLSRLDLGTMKFTFDNVSVREVLKDVVKEMYMIAANKSLMLNVSVADNVPLSIVVDKSRLHQVLINLVNNAVKYTDKKGKRITVSLAMQNGRVLFSVKDHGVGIARKDYSKLFKRFSQIDSSYTRKVGGSGLGLAISKGIVGALGGRIWLKSVLGKGTTFYFTLPVKSKVTGASEAELSVLGSPNEQSNNPFDEPEPKQNKKAFAKAPAQGAGK